MLKRLIPVLLVDRDKRLVKTIQFGQRTYVGDPLNVIRIFNEKEVDELIILDIDATSDKRKPDFNFIREMAAECFMPLSYGGGIKSIEDCEKLNRFGVEKFILGSSSLDYKLVNNIASMFGSQATVACVDVDTQNNATSRLKNFNNINITPEEHILNLEKEGVGEIIIQSINNDGLRSGYNLKLISQLASKLRVPLVALGGAGEYEHLNEAINAGASAAASGSVFTFIGRLRAVLINYPSSHVRMELKDD